MSPRPRVSIVIPAFNAGPWIERTVKAALRQTYPAAEIVIVNDASADRTSDVSERLAKRRRSPPIVYREHNVRQGGGATRNTGVEAASGDWILNLDADDLLPPTLLESFVATLAFAGEGTVVHTEFAQFFEDEPWTRLRLPITRTRLLHKWRYDGAGDDGFLTHSRSPASAGNRLFSRAMFDEVGGYFIDTGPYDAWSFGIKCYAIGAKFLHAPGTTYLHRLNANSYWMSNSRQGENRRYLHNALAHFPQFYSETALHALRPENPDYPADPFSVLMEQALSTA